MKILYNLPKESDTWRHDAPLYRVVLLGCTIFVLISSVTVFGGVLSFVNSNLSNSLPPFLMWPVYVLGYLVFSLAPDVLNTGLVMYITRAIYQKRRSVVDLVIVLGCSAVVVFLSVYSFQVSRESGKVVGSNLAGEASIQGTGQLDSARLIELARIDSLYAVDLASVTTSEAARVLVHEHEIKRLDGIKNAGNAQWIESRKSAQRAKIGKIVDAGIEAKAELRAARDEAVALVEGRYNDSRTRVVGRDSVTTAKHDGVATVLVSNSARVSGWAIFVALFLSVVAELIRLRNGVLPVPILSRSDFSEPGWYEVLAKPFRVVARNVLNRSRNWRQPDLVEPDAWTVIHDERDQQRVTLAKGQQSTTRNNDLTYDDEGGSPVSDGSGPGQSAGTGHPYENRIDENRSPYDELLRELFSDDSVADNRASIPGPSMSVGSAATAQNLGTRYPYNDFRPSANDFRPVRVLGFLPASRASALEENSRRGGSGSSGLGSFPPAPAIASGKSATHRLCLHCGGAYEVNHKKQRYCRDTCRIDAWKLRSGKHLHFSRGGKSGRK